jgi:hypothetical protein
MTEFAKINLDEMQQEDIRLNADGGGGFLDQFVPMPQVKPGATGSVTIRILPPANGAKLFQFNRVHTVNNRKVHCPRNLINGMWNKEDYCPICDYYQALWRQVDKLEEAGAKKEAEELKTEARSLKPVERYYYNAIVRKLVVEGGPTLENVGPRVLSIGKILHKKIIRAFVGDDSQAALGDVTHVENGYDFIIRKEVERGSNSWPKYGDSSFARESSPLGTKAQVKEWVESLYDLSKFRNIKDAEYLDKELAIHRGIISDENETFNIDTFDAKMSAKFKGNGQTAELMKDAEKLGSSVSVPEGVPSSTGVVAETTDPPAVPEIEDDEFFAELEQHELD